MTHRWNVAVRVPTWISSLCACLVFMQAPAFDRRAAAGDGLERAHGWPWCNDQQTDRRVKMALRVETPEVSTTGSVHFTLTLTNTGAEAVSLSTPLAFGHNLFLRLEGGAGAVPMSGVMTGIVPGKPRVLLPRESLSLEADLRHLSGFTVPPLAKGEYSLHVCYVDTESSMESEKDQRRKPPQTRPSYLTSSTRFTVKD
jgi:hypothetical protein